MASVSSQSLNLKAGEWVWVRSKEEILATLDKNGRLDELPFMPQMFRFCGQKLQIAKRAHKLCDTQYGSVGRTMKNAVTIGGLRCHGEGFGDCEMSCLFIWKEAWLKRVDGPEQPLAKGVGCTEAELIAATIIPPSPDAISLGPKYVCQATQMAAATKHLPFWSIPHFIEDFTSGNVTLSVIVSGIFFAVYYNLAESGLGFGSAMRWIYDKIQGIRGKTPYVQRRGHLPMNGKTPTLRLDLKPGELVRIKSHEEILDTVNENLVNRGMGFHPELVPFCDKTFEVKFRVGKIINEKTGHLMELKNPCIVLEGIPCAGHYTKPLFCPRDCYPYWREIWLERVDGQGKSAAERETVCQQTT
jgi:hypothetical protein